MLLLAAADQNAVCLHPCKCHPNPHIKYHMRVLPVPLLGEERCEALLHAFDLPTCNTVNSVDHGREVLALRIEGG